MDLTPELEEQKRKLEAEIAKKGQRPMVANLSEKERVNMLRLIDMANALNQQSQRSKYKESDAAFNSLYERYEELERTLPGLFQAALMGKMYEGETGRFVKLYQENAGSAATLNRAINGYTADQTRQVEDSLKRAKNLGLI